MRPYCFNSRPENCSNLDSGSKYYVRDYSGTVAVGLVDYAAARLGRDAEECIQKALGDGEIGMCGRSG